MQDNFSIEQARKAIEATKAAMDEAAEAMSRGFAAVRDMPSTEGQATYIYVYEGKNRHERRKESKLSRKKK